MKRTPPMKRKQTKPGWQFFGSEKGCWRYDSERKGVYFDDYSVMNLPPYLEMFNEDDKNMIGYQPSPPITKEQAVAWFGQKADLQEACDEAETSFVDSFRPDHRHPATTSLQPSASTP